MLSRVIRVGTTLVVMGLMCASAVAQPGGQRGPGGPGGGRGGFGAGGGASDLMRLLSAPEVRKEVKLSDEGWAAVEKLQKEQQEAMRAGFAGFSRDASDADREKFRTQAVARMKEANEKSQALLDEVLPPEGLDRLMGLYVQLNGDSSITGELPAKKLGLSDDDKKKIEEAVAKAREASRGQGGAAPGAGGGRPDFNSPEFRARMAEARKKSDEAAVAALSDGQKKALADLKGAKFEFPEGLRGGPGGFGGFGGFGGGPGGNRGQGGRPGARPTNE